MKNQGKCQCCKNYFKPSPRLGGRQKTCGNRVCRKKHRSFYQRRWRKLNKVIDLEYESKRKGGRPKDFWKKYRKHHPEYEMRNRFLTKLRKRLKKEGLQRKLDIVQAIEMPNKLIDFSEFATRHRSIIQDALGSGVSGGGQTHADTGTSG